MAGISVDDMSEAERFRYWINSVTPPFDGYEVEDVSEGVRGRIVAIFKPKTPDA